MKLRKSRRSRSPIMVMMISGWSFSRKHSRGSSTSGTDTSSIAEWDASSNFKGDTSENFSSVMTRWSLRRSISRPPFLLCRAKVCSADKIEIFFFFADQNPQIPPIHRIHQEQSRFGGLLGSRIVCMPYALTDTQRDMVDVILDGENPDNAFIATQVGCATRQVRNMAANKRLYGSVVKPKINLVQGCPQLSHKEAAHTSYNATLFKKFLEERLFPNCNQFPGPPNSSHHGQCTNTSWYRTFLFPMLNEGNQTYVWSCGIRLEYLPWYLPDLNPIEDAYLQSWRHGIRRIISLRKASCFRISWSLPSANWRPMRTVVLAVVWLMYQFATMGTMRTMRTMREIRDDVLAIFLLALYILYVVIQEDKNDYIGFRSDEVACWPF